MSNIGRIFDELSSEDYLCHKLRPVGHTICTDCHNIYESYWDDLDERQCCVHCGSMNDPYKED